MTNAALVRLLQGLPPDAEVGYVSDGAMRSHVDLVWLSVRGAIVLSGRGERVYEREDRPAWAPSEAEDPYWWAGEEPRI